MNRCGERERYPVFRESIGGPVREKPELCEIPGCGDIASVLDHCHRTGRFRGWLCYGCNSGLGKFGDNAAGFRAALAYLEKFEALPPLQLELNFKPRLRVVRSEPRVWPMDEIQIDLDDLHGPAGNLKRARRLIALDDIRIDLDEIDRMAASR
jgi:Recombination endonuclease VII